MDATEVRFEMVNKQVEKILFYIETDGVRLQQTEYPFHGILYPESIKILEDLGYTVVPLMQSNWSWSRFKFISYLYGHIIRW